MVRNQARSYDAGTASWTAADSWAGLLVQPRSLARYGYVWNNPATHLDPDGHVCAKRGPGDALPLGCGAPPVQAYENVTMPPPAPPYVPTKPAKPKPTGPTDKNINSERHEPSYGEKVAANWDSTWANVGPNWEKTWERFFDNPQARSWDPVWQWLGEHATWSGQYCGGVLCVQIGPDGFGVGPAVAAGVTGSAGLANGGLSGLGFTVGCSASDGAGVYATYSRDWQGREAPDVGASSGVGLGCSGLIMWFW